MKKTIAVLTSLLLFACSSATDVIDQRSIECGPGQDLEVRAGLAPPEVAGTVGQMMFLVEVANNSHDDVTVDHILIEPRQGQRSRPGQIALERVHRSVKTLIAEGTEHVFELPASRFQGPSSAMDSEFSARGGYEFFVHVALTNGDAYRCPFAVELR